MLLVGLAFILYGALLYFSVLPPALAAFLTGIICVFVAILKGERL